jgi:hypothetical protein
VWAASADVPLRAFRHALPVYYTLAQCNVHVHSDRTRVSALPGRQFWIGVLQTWHFFMPRHLTLGGGTAAISLRLGMTSVVLTA